MVYFPADEDLKGTYFQYEGAERELKDLVAFAVEGNFRESLENKKAIAKELSGIEKMSKKVSKFLSSVSDELDYWLEQSNVPEEHMYWVKYLWVFTLCVLAATPILVCPILI